MLPTFLVIGAAKCGTSSLCARLGDHPEVFFSVPKEIHYFGRDDERKTLGWYQEHFKEAEGYRAIGEGSTSYTHPSTIRRCVDEIFEMLPAARLIYMVRNPLRRLESDWRMRMHEGWTDPDINVAVQEEKTTLITHGLYWRRLQEYVERFPEEQIEIVFLEDFAASPQEELIRCFRHIGVDPDVSIDRASKAENRSKDFRKDGAVASLLRRSGMLGFARKVVPETLFHAGKSVLTESDTHAPKWDPGVRRNVWDGFLPDFAELLDYCGKPSDFWSYPSDSPRRPQVAGRR